MISLKKMADKSTAVMEHLHGRATAVLLYVNLHSRVTTTRIPSFIWKRSELEPANTHFCTHWRKLCCSAKTTSMGLDQSQWELCGDCKVLKYPCCSDCNYIGVRVKSFYFLVFCGRRGRRQKLSWLRANICCALHNTLCGSDAFHCCLATFVSVRCFISQVVVL